MRRPARLTRLMRLAVLHFWHVLCALWWFAMAMPVTHTAYADTSATAPEQMSVQATLNALSRAHASVVGVQVTVAGDAQSADTLGQARLGSGVMITDDGLILTIGYLILEAEQIEIVLADRQVLPARPVAYDLATGFGLLRPLVPISTASGTRAAPLAPPGSVAGLQSNALLMAVTGPQPDDDGDVGMTRLVGTRAFSGTWEYHIDTALFTSPPITSSSGNHSGAPLFNQQGELIGIGSLLVADATGGNRRLPGNMFVPVDLLRPILAEMQQSGTSNLSRRPWLGLTSSDQNGRVQVVRVSKDSPAQDAGMRAGDVVLAVDEAKVSTLEDFYKKIWSRAAPDAEIKLSVLQGDEVKTLVVKAQDRMQTLKKPSGI